MTTTTQLRSRVGELPVEGPRTATRERRGFFRRRPKLTRLLIALLVLAGLSFLALGWVERTGQRFFDTGRTLVDSLGEMAGAIEAGDLDAIGAFYASDFAGDLLGLTGPHLASSRNGLETWRFTASGGADRAAVVDEWREYLAGFSSVDEVGLHIHRLEEWGDDDAWVAVVRYELIGTPAGRPRAGIDRTQVRMTFRPTDDRPRIVAAELVEGSRVIADEPHFVAVGEEAGIAFENGYYPQFLEQKLVFGMLRYGPAGITAADVDGDGWEDLFIPDGVEARLFRNLRDGTFEDITAASGLAGLDGVGTAVFADWDNDGDADAFVSRTFTPNQVFRNDGVDESGQVRFTDVTAASGIGADCCTTVASWADYDLDGDLDLYVGRYLEPREAIPTTFYARNGEPNQLYRNDGTDEAGQVRFTNVTEETGVGEIGLCLGSSFADYDEDGWPDLHVSNDFGRKTLYRNLGPGADGVVRFEDVTVATGTLAYGAGMSSSWGDYDNDGHLDIYVAHIRSEHGWYAEWPTVLRYMANSWTQGVWPTDMPLYFQILRQSGFQFVQVFQDMASGNTLLRNRGDGTFGDTTWQAEANPPGWFWGTNFADFDNDGWLDLYAANGWVYNDRGTEIELEFLNNVVTEQRTYKTGIFFDPEFFGVRSWHGWERNRHLLNRGPDDDGQVGFQEVGRATGTDLLTNSRGTAVADFWNRGALDLAVAASTDRHQLLRNDVGTRHRWLGVKLIGAAGELAEGSNRDAVGARVTLRDPAFGQQTREVLLGDGYASQSTLRVYFGLAGLDRVAELTVRWPRSGQVETFRDVAADQIIEIREGRGEIVAANVAAGGERGEEPEAADDASS